MGRWKGLRRGLEEQPDAPIELYDLAADVGESRDVAAAQPNVAGRVREIMQRARTASEQFPLPA
jgi:hypothetical protein